MNRFPLCNSICVASQPSENFLHENLAGSFDPARAHSMQNRLKPIENEEKLVEAIKNVCQQYPDYEHFPSDSVELPSPINDLNDRMTLVGGKILEDYLVGELEQPTDQLFFLVKQIEAIVPFRSESNIELLKRFLDHQGVCGKEVVVEGGMATPRTKTRETLYFVRLAAYKVLVNWGVKVDKPELVATK